MPVYIRKNVSYTPPSLDKIPHEDEDDFMADPELLRDDLPQPYRMIDKTLRTLFDETWEFIAEREEERLAEARKVRPPQYKYSVVLDGPVPGALYPEKQSLSYATCMCDSPDGAYIFMGLPCGLVAMESLNQQFIGSWEDPNAEITYIKSHLIGTQMYMIVTIDDMGIGRLFAFAYNKMFLLKVMNASPQDSDSKILVAKMEASIEGDYLGMVMENPSNHDMWLEVHKLPRDPWVSDLDTIITAMKKKEEKEEKSKEDVISEQDTESVIASEMGTSQVDGQEASLASLPSGTAPADTGDQSQTGGHSSASNSGRSLRFNSYSRQSQNKPVNKKSRPGSGGSGQGAGLIHENTDVSLVSIERPKDPLSGDYKFASPQLITKLKVQAPATGVTMSNLQSACQKVDGADVVGTGQNQLFTQGHLDLRQSVFDHLHDNLLKYLPDDDEEDHQLQQFPNFHFLTAGRMLPLGLEQPSLNGRPTTIAVWWPGSTNLLQYSLIKTSKDLEFKPDLVWPFTCKITCTEVSPDTNVIAIGLENGNVVIWDRYMGTQRGVVNVRDDSAVVQLKFLDPSMYPQGDVQYPPYPTRTCAYLLVMCANSALYHLATGPGMNLQPSTISIPVEKDDHTVTLLQPFTAHPDMLLTVTRSGEIQIRDTLQGKIICQVQLPDTHEMSSPWDPVLALGGQGHMIYLKANKKQEEDSSETGTESNLQTGSVFVYQLRSFPTLDEYWKIQRTSLPFTVHTKLDQRVDSLLADRISQQGMRRARMQERWAGLRDEINHIHHLKETARIKAEHRPVVNYDQTVYPHWQTPGSVGRVQLFT